jgi:hypothetical protein
LHGNLKSISIEVKYEILEKAIEFFVLLLSLKSPGKLKLVENSKLFDDILISELPSTSQNRMIVNNTKKVKVS